MAKKRKARQTKTPIEECTLTMQAHIHQLGLSSVEDYKSWCSEHNFSRGLDKNSRKLRNELNVATTIKACKIMANEKKYRNLKEIIPQIYDEKLQSEKLRNGTAKEIVLAFNRSNSRDVLLKLLLYLEENSDLLEDLSYIKGIEAIANHSESWIGPLRRGRSKDITASVSLPNFFATYSLLMMSPSLWIAFGSLKMKHIRTGINILAWEKIYVPHQRYLCR